MSKAPAQKTFWDTSNIPKAKEVLTVKVLNRTNGKYPDSKVYWTFGGRTRSIAQQPEVDMPANSAGRMYFHLGSPTSKYSDFIEFTVGADQFNGNTTRVDAFVLKIAMRLHSADGSNLTVGETEKVFAESWASTFTRFRAAVPAEFKHLAEGTDKILSPGGDPEFKAGGKYANYFASYTKAASTSDILGCAGPLGSSPNECAQLNRHVTAANASKTSAYYRAAPANFYAKFWHDNAIGGRAYGFPYDDVNAQSSYISHSDPQYLLVAVGF
ncbi:hypothetical protein GCM10010172_87380 [Paractinoplanes ferrugineus]|uniref:GH64 domain-containing protein n=1 Tax=Paractinoplanes ferrugineus TaxID=113564 RepID=A0A919JBB9_9ACTN|nr:glycoside hydrolase family 64 protein [Actinoplanes ferrugineus]GIE16513.1 hypothetical protein Afe05nite_83530 [Actinoplanes ferrugineus]